MVTIITGVIKANFPSSAAFRVTSKTDSRVILDMNGAETLLGRGDMLFAPGGNPIRVQGGFATTDEVEKVADFLREQAKPNYFDIDLTPEDELDGEDGEGGEDRDELYQEALGVVMDEGTASTSLLQRRMKIGYGRAARILDQMHAEGIIGPARGSRAREIIG